MHFTICSQDYITYHSNAHTRTILTHSNTRDAINLSMQGLITAGATEFDSRVASRSSRAGSQISLNARNRRSCTGLPPISQARL